MTVPILWNNPIKLLDLFPKTRSYKLYFWKHMNLYSLEFMIKKAVNYEESKIINLGKEILDLFNKYTKFVSLYVQNLHHNNIIEAIINRSIKKLKYIEFDIRKSGINRLIEVQKIFREVDFTYYPIDSSNPEIVEESLIKCSNTIQYDDGSLLQAIYQNCPNLSYLKLTLNDRNISEFENVLINCQYLMGLVIREYYDSCYSKVLTSFLGNWKDRHSILLHAYSARGDPKNQQLKDLLQSYKVKCIIKKYETCGGFEDFEWINKLGTIL
ncbi:hypothetical protein RhiirA1_454350 [Rhizophagus irregularis]|uniref:Uncharacterized protein n=1 Tax=Rhizophagus irregularis TaxID=588596 RepID=A0A2N0S5D2_9GLOM|nr:hypothetical protein RhiirA1_454350 [Rhizophagus irregularis]